MKILGLPPVSFLLLIAIPWALILFQFYHCWIIYRKSRESKKRGE